MIEEENITNNMVLDYKDFSAVDQYCSSVYCNHYKNNIIILSIRPTSNARRRQNQTLHDSSQSAEGLAVKHQVYHTPAPHCSTILATQFKLLYEQAKDQPVNQPLLEKVTKQYK